MESEEKGRMKKSFSCIAVVIRIYCKYPWLSLNLSRNIKNIIREKCYQNSHEKPHVTLGHSGISSLNGEKILPVKALLSYILLCQVAHFNNDDSIARAHNEKTGNEDEDLESRLPKT